MNLIALNSLTINLNKRHIKTNEKANMNGFESVLKNNIDSKKEVIQQLQKNVISNNNYKESNINTNSKDNNLNNTKEVISSQTQNKDCKTERKIDIKDIEKKALEKIAKAMGISEEELSNIMTLLNLNFIDLFSNENIKTLFKETFNLKSDVDLLSNNNVFNILKEVNQVLKDILIDENISINELNQVLEKESGIKEVEVNNEIQYANNNISKEKQEQDTNLKIEIVDSRTKKENSQTENHQEIENSVTEENNNSKIDSNNLTNSSNNLTNNSNNSNDSKNNTEINNIIFNSNKSKVDSNSNKVNFENQFDNILPHSTVNKFETISVNTLGEIVYQETTVKDIINQITTQVKIAFTNKTTTISFHLQPENLGKIAFSVRNENGLMTGSIIAENNSVKEALEMNLSNLKANLNQQGIQLDEIRVIVGNTNQFFENSDKEKKSNNYSGDKKRKSFGNEEKGFGQKIEETREILRNIDLDENINQVDYIA